MVYEINKDLLFLCEKADLHDTQQGQKATCLEEAARTMNKAFAVCATDRYSEPENSRKWGVYGMVNLLFKTYFKVSLCDSTLARIYEFVCDNLENVAFG